MVRYYGHYSNVSRGKRKKHDQDNLIPSILEPDRSSKEYRKNWARLIQKIAACPGLDPGKLIPLTCPKCSGVMKVISVIEDEEVIKKILKHLGLWAVKSRPPPKGANAPPPEIHTDYCYSQVPLSEDHLYRDPEYPIEGYTSS